MTIFHNCADPVVSRDSIGTIYRLVFYSILSVLCTVQKLVWGEGD